MQHVLLTGGTGFVGRQILQCLSDLGCRVTLAVREGGSQRLPSDLPNTLVIEAENLFAQPASWWANNLDTIDTVIHSAWYAEPGKYLTSTKNLDCLIGTLELAKAAAQCKVKRFVGLGSCVEYRPTEATLQTNAPLEATTPYAGAKLAAFHALQQHFLQTETTFLWCRLFYLFGEGEHPNRLVPFLHRTLENNEVAELTSGNQIRDFMDVSDAAKRIVELSQSNLEGPANVCSGQGQSVRELAEKIADTYQRRELLKFGARPDNAFDPPYVVGEPTLPLRP